MKIKELISNLESLTDKCEKQENPSKDDELEIRKLSSIIGTYEILHYPIGTMEEKYSKIIKELFYNSEAFFEILANPKKPMEKESNHVPSFTKEDLALVYRIGFGHAKAVAPFQQKEVIEAFCNADNWYKNINWD
jgi:hypothetical protein